MVYIKFRFVLRFGYKSRILYAMKNVSVFRYIGYQDYLSDYFVARKKCDPAFSHRFLSSRLGLSSPNFVMMVMQGKRKLTRSLAFKLAQEFKLGRREAEYFECMVEFCRARSAQEKDRFLSRMMELRKGASARTLDDRQYAYYSRWYNLVVRELVTYPGVDSNYALLGRHVFPAITPGQAKASVELLLELGLIKKKGRGYVRTSPLLTTGPQVRSVAVANFHRAMALLGSSAIDKVPGSERDMTSCTASVSEAGFERIKEEIAECRRRIMAFAEKDSPASRVYQINFHAFPVSRKNPG